MADLSRAQLKELQDMPKEVVVAEHTHFQLLNVRVSVTMPALPHERVCNHVKIAHEEVIKAIQLYIDAVAEAGCHSISNICGSASEAVKKMHETDGHDEN